MRTLETIIHWAESDLSGWENDAKTPVPVPTSVSSGAVSGASKAKTAVTLKAIENLKSINAIPDGTSLCFGHKGLTVVYGENGAGKSGYARVLKHACRARDTNERLLPSIFSSVAAGPAEASFKISVDGAPDQSIQWQDGQAADPVLTNIAVFDSKCARIIVDEKNQAQYLPYGLKKITCGRIDRVKSIFLPINYRQRTLLEQIFRDGEVDDHFKKYWCSSENCFGCHIDHVGRTAASWYGVRFKPVKLYQKFYSDTVIKLGGYDFQCIHTPGHTPRSISILVESVLIKASFIWNIKTIFQP